MRLFVIFIALVVAVAAGVGFFLFTKSDEQEAQVVVVTPQATAVQVQDTPILVARQDIPVGKRITAEDIDRQPWPQHLVLEGFLPVGSEAQLIDMVARTPFKAREPFTTSRLGNPNDPGFLAASLSKGMRAITVPIDAVSGVGGFVFPGDRVDIIITHKIGLGQNYKSTDDITVDSAAGNAAKGAVPEKPDTAIPLPLESSYKVPMLMTPGKRDGQPVMAVTEVLVSAAKVLAVGQQSTQYENANAVPTNITLEVTDLQAEKIRHADVGALSLALRSLEDKDDIAIPRPVGDTDMSRLTPPSYFPYVYNNSEYEVKNVDLGTVEYGAEEAVDEKPSGVAVIRGVEKEIVGVSK